MKVYSDTTHEVFKRTLALLKPQLPSAVFMKIEEAIEKGTFDDVDQVVKAIEMAMAEEAKGSADR
ncbi:MAG: hypothetical protein ABSD38_14450 [Syntrophorhabdales bacterium]|jgi:hypothetical protein